MKDNLILLYFVIFAFSLAACQPQGKNADLVDDKDSSFTLIGAGE